MLINQGVPYRKIYLFGAFVFLITAWFSTGYNHFDEHFQILEFAGYKLGLTDKASLPWEFSNMMRPAFQPAVVFVIYKIFASVGISDPFFISFFFRLFSACLTFFGIHRMIRLYFPENKNEKLLRSFLLLSFFLWFVPYNAARFSSDTTSGVVFIIGLTWFLQKAEQKSWTFFITGIVMGLSFLVKIQMVLMIAGFALWLLIIHKCAGKNFLLFIAGIVFSLLLGILLDRWLYGEWTLTAVSYFRQNVILGKASGFGTFPWWYYFTQVFMNAIPPLSLVYIFAFAIYFWKWPKDVLTWTLLPFLVIHFLIPHKEIRFLFPVIGFLPVMIIKSADVLLSRNDYAGLEKKASKIFINIFWITNFVMLAILAFRPADDQIALYRKLWKKYSSPVNLYFTEENPYHRAGADVCFYRRKNLFFRKTDSIQAIIPSRDTTALAVTNRPFSKPCEKFTPVLIYSSLPPWMMRFDINHWVERTSFWYIYELKPKNHQGS